MLLRGAEVGGGQVRGLDFGQVQGVEVEGGQVRGLDVGQVQGAVDEGVLLQGAEVEGGQVKSQNSKEPVMGEPLLLLPQPRADPNILETGFFKT